MNHLITVKDIVPCHSMNVLEFEINRGPVVLGLEGLVKNKQLILKTDASPPKTRAIFRLFSVLKGIKS